MSIDLKGFFNEEKHYEKVKKGSQKIRIQHAHIPAPSYSPLYLNDLFDYFKNDIEVIAKQIYETALLNRSTKEIKVTPSELKILIKKSAESFLQKYADIIQNYQTRRIINEYAKIQEDLQEECEKQSMIYSEKYKDYLRKRHNEILILYASIIAAITGILEIIKDWIS